MPATRSVPAVSGSPATGTRSQSGTPVVDVHNHVLTPAVEDLIRQHYSPEEIVANEPNDLYAGGKSATHNRSLKPELTPKMTDAAQRVRDMDRVGVDIQVLATFVSQFYYWTEGELGQQIARIQNDWVAELASSHPSRFSALGTLPMQDSTRAVAELEYVVSDLGFTGVQISSNVDGRDLDDPRFLPRRVHFDTMVFTPEQITHLLEFAGADHILLGTDHPFDMGEPDPVGLTGKLDVSEAERALIRGGNAVRLFGLE
ncbi:MAG: amidohydrolase family protein [Acidimicrobiales bacterium]